MVYYFDDRLSNGLRLGSVNTDDGREVGRHFDPDAWQSGTKGISIATKVGYSAVFVILCVTAVWFVYLTSHQSFKCLLPSID